MSYVTFFSPPLYESIGTVSLYWKLSNIIALRDEWQLWQQKVKLYICVCMFAYTALTLIFAKWIFVRSCNRDLIYYPFNIKELLGCPQLIIQSLLYLQILYKKEKQLFDSVPGIIMLVGWLLGKDILEMFTISVR